MGWTVAGKGESQDLCFLADGDYRRFLQDWASEAIQSGPITDRAGNVLGEHKGLPFYTIGQRKGLGLSSPDRLFVLELRAETNTLVVGPAEYLGQDQLTAKEVHWVNGAAPPAPIQCTVKIRYRAHDHPATLQLLPDNRVAVQFAEPLRDITPGQAAVFYQDERCLGGGIIEHQERDRWHG